jgi:hypothetical protein
MRTLIRQVALAIVIAAMAVGLTTVAEAGEKKKFHYTKTARQTVVETKMAAGGIPERELVQGVYIDSCKSPDPDFEGMKEHVYNQDENGAGGSGMHRGYSIDELKSGDQVFQRYEGTHKLVVKDGGAWEVNYQGKAEIIGGTGKYKNARGQLKYKGRITADGITEEDTGEIEY